MWSLELCDHAQKPHPHHTNSFLGTSMDDFCMSIRNLTERLIALEFSITILSMCDNYNNMLLGNNIDFL